MFKFRFAAALPLGAGLLMLGACQLGSAGNNALSGSGCVVDSETIAIAAVRQAESRGVTSCKGGNRVKLAGVIAPKTTEPNGTVATAVLIGLVDGELLTCTDKGSSGGTSLVSCTVRGRDIGKDFIERGGALACSDAAPDYTAAEKTAQAAKRGLWALDWKAPAGSCRKG